MVGSSVKKHLLEGGADSDGALPPPEAYVSITPRDEFNLAYISFLLLGAGFLFPWNAVITAVDYFNSLFPGKGIEFYFTVAYMCPNLVGLVFVVNWGHRLSFFLRIVVGFLIFLVVLVIMPFIKNMTVSVTMVGILGFSDAIVQGSIYGLAGQFHPRYVNAVMSGNGVAGFTVSALRLITKGVVPPDDDKSGRLSASLYFGISGVVIIVCILMYAFVLQRSPVTKFYLNKTSEERNKYLSTLSARVLTKGDIKVSRTEVESFGLDMTSDAPGAIEKGEADTAETEATAEMMRTNALNPLQTFAKVWPMALCAAFNFLITLSLFPGITSEMVSTNKRIGDWYPIILITLFNFSDLCGRTMPRWESLIFITRKYLVIPTILRLAFIPLFLLSLSPHKVFESDVWMYLFMLMFGLTNGYCGTLAMMYGPEMVGVIDKETAGTVMVFCLTTGLTGGVWLGVLFKGMVDNGTF